MASLLFEHLSKEYAGGIAAVSDLSFAIEDKEFIVFVGPSGCGKSTTLRMIAGLEKSSRGELYIGNTLVNGMAPKDRNISMVFQNYALYPHMTVYDNIAFGLKLRKKSKTDIRERVEEAAKILDITGLLPRRPGTLSGGQKQRVALGRAMVMKPNVFLLDEPLSNLDAKLRTQMRMELSRLHKKLQTTFIYVTHDQTEAMTMGDRIVVMKDGVVQQVDTHQHLYERPDNMFVAGFIGSPQMNFIPAKIIRQGESLCAAFEGLNGKARIKLPPEKVGGYGVAPYIDQEVILGIRPEHIRIDREIPQAEKSGSMKMRVDLVEMLGAETYLHLNLGGARMTARVPPCPQIHAGETLQIILDANKIHLFDRENQAAILH